MSIKTKLLKLFATKVLKPKFDDLLSQGGFTSGEEGEGLKSPSAVSDLLPLIPIAAAAVAVPAYFLSKRSGSKSDTKSTSFSNIFNSSTTSSTTSSTSASPASYAPSTTSTNLPSVVSSTHNRYVDNAVNYNLGKSTRAAFDEHREMIQSYLSEYGVDPNMANMVIMESGAGTAKKNAQGMISSGVAYGYWQFTKATGKSYGLTSNADFMDWNKSTQAAAKYMANLYNRYFKCWDLVVMAYNCGPGNVQKAMKKAGIDPKRRGDFTQEEIWRIWEHVPAESQGYYVKWLRLREQNNQVQSRSQTPSYSMVEHYEETSLSESPNNRRP